MRPAERFFDPDPLLHPVDRVLDQPTPQPIAGGRELRVGEQRVGARHQPARVGTHRYAA